jgi:hypothetical protein
MAPGRRVTTFSEQMKFGTPLGAAPNGALYNQVVNGHLYYYYQQMRSNETGECEQRRGLAPVISKLSLRNGPAAGGMQVTIAGVNFKGPGAAMASRSRRLSTNPARSLRHVVETGARRMPRRGD